MRDTYKRSVPRLEGLDKDTVEVWDLVPPEKGVLTKLKAAAVRYGLWRRVLKWSDQMYMNALILARWNYIRIRSPLVLRILAPIVKKLLSTLGRHLKAFLHVVCKDAVDEEVVAGALSLMGETAYKMMKTVAKKISQIAQGWGNELAHKWPEDAGFIRYLMVMSLPQNRNPPMFTVCAP